MVNDGNVNVKPNSKVRVIWSDKSENYSREGKNRVQKYLSDKYGVDKTNIQVNFVPIKRNENGDEIKIDGATIDNIMDFNYQKGLFKEWLDREGKEIDFDRIITLDNKVNSELDLTDNVNNGSRYKLRWIKIDNFLSFGNDNFFNVDNYKGLTVVNSLPENMGGKTTLTVDAIKFLFYGKTSKTDKNEEIFNTFSNQDSLMVKGLVTTNDGDDVVIERVMSRGKAKNGTWNIKNQVNYYKVLPDGEEVLLNEEDSVQTTKKIKETIGSERDFDLITLSTAKNLDDLIDFTPTESGKLLSRFIGLEVIEQKEVIARKQYNEFTKTMKSNHYNISTLGEEIETHTINIQTLKTTNEVLCKEFNELEIENKSKKDKKDKLLSSKVNIDSEILTLNPSNIEKDIEKLIQDGIRLDGDVKTFEKRLLEIGNPKFEELVFESLNKDINVLKTDIAIKNNDVNRLKGVIKSLVDGGICQSCNRKLDNVDNTEHIKKHESDINNMVKLIETNQKVLDELLVKLTNMNSVKVLVDEKNNLELKRDRLKVDIDVIRNNVKSKKVDLKQYNQNIEAIEINKNIDSQISQVNTELSVLEYSKGENIKNTERNTLEITNNENLIKEKEIIIKTIKKEMEVETIYKTYIEMVGKKGISKLILRSILPIINFEISRLLEDIADFEVEIKIDEKNDVKLLLIKDDIEKQLKSGSGFERTASALALRCVLGKMTTLPMPNFITFDEILGRVAAINIEKMKLLFDKVKLMYDNIFFITQNDIVKDWGDNIITVVKEDNISRIG